MSTSLGAFALNPVNNQGGYQSPNGMEAFLKENPTFANQNKQPVVASTAGNGSPTLVKDPITGQYSMFNGNQDQNQNQQNGYSKLPSLTLNPQDQQQNPQQSPQQNPQQPQSSSSLVNFQVALMNMLQQAQKTQQQGTAGLLAQKQNLANQGLDQAAGVSNIQNLTPEQRISLRGSTADVTNPAQLSVTNQLQLANQGTQAQVDLVKQAAGYFQPTAVPFGASLYDPATGQLQSTMDADSQSLISKAMAEGRLTSADIGSRYSIPYITATLKRDPGYNFVSQKAGNTADTQSLQTQQTYADTIHRSYATALDNFKILMGSMGNINDSNSPAINQITNNYKNTVSGDGALNAFQTNLQSLRSEYALILGKGSVTVEGMQEAAKLIPDNISKSALLQVFQRLNAEGANAIKEADAQVQAIKGRVGQGYGSGGTDTSGASGGGQTQTINGHTYQKTNGGWQLVK